MEKSLAAGSLGPWPSRGSDSLIVTTLNSSWSAVISDSSKPKCLMFHWFLLLTQYCLFCYQLPSLLTLQSSIFSRRRFCNNTDCFDLITHSRLATVHSSLRLSVSNVQCTDSLCLASTGLHWPGPTNEPPPWPPLLLPGPGPLFTDMARSGSEERHNSTEDHK